jgi:hypothetical protein
MIELVVLAALMFAGFVVFGALSLAASMVGWVVLLPFKLLGVLFRGAAFLLALPFVLLFGLLAVMIGGFGLLVLFLPLIPFALLVWLAWRLVRTNRASAHSSAPSSARTI